MSSTQTNRFVPDYLVTPGEVGHILKHGRKGIFIEGNELDGKKEDEADAYASDKLIPPARMRWLLKDGNPTLNATIKSCMLRKIKLIHTLRFLGWPHLQAEH